MATEGASLRNKPCPRTETCRVRSDFFEREFLVLPRIFQDPVYFKTGVGLALSSFPRFIKYTSRARGLRTTVASFYDETLLFAQGRTGRKGKPAARGSKLQSFASGASGVVRGRMKRSPPPSRSKRQEA